MSFLSPEIQNNPFEFYQALHEQAPLYQMPETGMYIVSRYGDLRAILQDSATFTNHMDMGFIQGENYKVYQDILEKHGWPELNTLNFSDPPEHTKYRRIADSVFNARRIEAVAPKIESIVNDIIDSFIDDGECEFVSQFSFPLVGTVISDLLGLEATQMHTFKKWGDAIMLPVARPLSVDELRETAWTIVEMQQYMAQKIEERRLTPQDDLISALVHAELDNGSKLNMAELQSLMRQFISGTFESVVTAITHGVWLLLRFPDQMEKLRQNKQLVKDFTEETLRFDSPVPGLARIVTKDTVVEGISIPKGAIVMTRYAAANRDPDKFECPHKFDIERQDKSHMAFGAGPHICIGRVLARREMNTAFSMILSRMDNIALARPLPKLAHIPHLLLRPMKELYIRFDKIA